MAPGGGDRWLIVQHVAHEGPGLIGESLAEHGLPYDVVRTDRGEPFPDHRSVAGLVVMGGPPWGSTTATSTRGWLRSGP